VIFILYSFDNCHNGPSYTVADDISMEARCPVRTPHRSEATSPFGAVGLQEEALFDQNQPYPALASGIPLAHDRGRERDPIRAVEDGP
jgi:hypothetical protein